MRQGLLASTSRLRGVMVGCILAALFVAAFAASSPTAMAAPQVSSNTMRPQVWVRPSEGQQHFCDYDIGVCFAVDGLYEYNCGCPGPIYQQIMGVTVEKGGYWGDIPSTRVEEWINGRYVQTFKIQNYNCVSPGYPDASVCGSNGTQVYSNTCEVMKHYWVAVNGDGLAFSSLWSHTVCA